MHPERREPRLAQSSVGTPPRASFVRPGKREIPTASIAITSPGAAGGGEAVGTARTMLAGVTLAIYRENAAFDESALQAFDLRRAHGGLRAKGTKA